MKKTAASGDRLKIVFVSFHLWKSNRQGGFHRFARAAWERGADVLFVTDSLAWSKFLSRPTDRSGFRTLLRAVLGSTFEHPDSKAELRSVACPTLKVPYRLRRLLPNRFCDRLSRTYWPAIASRVARFSSAPDVIVFESSDALPLLAPIARRFPEAKVLYRPSDPLIGNPDTPEAVRQAEQVALQTADKTLLVNEISRQLYLDAFELSDETARRMEIVQNGVEVSSFQRDCDKPEAMQGDQKVACYVGAMRPNWGALVKLARKMPSLKVVVVCPEPPPSNYAEVMAGLPNLIDIPGIPPSEVPAYTRHCDVFISPYPGELYRTKPWGLLAKLMQAMAARRPIVCMNMGPELREHGIEVTYEVDDFIAATGRALAVGAVDYDFDFGARDWSVCEAAFMQSVDRVLDA